MNEKNSAQAVQHLDVSVILHNFLQAAKRLLWIAVVLALIVGGVVYYRTDRSYSPLYSSSAVFSVTANYAGTTDILSYTTYMNIAAASNLSATFSYVINSDNMTELLRKELGRATINASITATSTADAALFTMTVKSYNAQNAYDVLLATVKVYPQAASSIIGDTQIQIINLPDAPSTEPVNVNTALSSGLTAAGVTFLVGLVAVFLISLLRKTIHSSEDLRNLVNLQCLAYIPFVKQKKRSDQTQSRLLLTNPRIESFFSESVRSLRVKLLKLLEQNNARVVMVTSTIPNEGKSTIAANLALSLCAEGKRVILIDADLRKQSLKTMFGLTAPSDGLVEMLSGDVTSFRLLTVPNSSLLLLSGDITSDQPQPLLDSDKMRQIIDLLRSKLDYVIIDSPPAGILSDAATIAKYVDSTLYVVRQDLSDADRIRDSIHTLSDVGIPLVGCVLNGTKVGTTRYGYGGKYSGYSYGYKYSDSYGGYSRRRTD